VQLWLNRLGPYHNPHEQYHFYSLPFCRPAARLEPATRQGGLADMFGELENSDLEIRFRKDVERSTICSMTLDPAGAQLLSYAVSNHYWYQMYLDELPMWAMVGEVVANEDVIREIESHTDRPHGMADATYLYLHKNFTVLYNGDRVIEVNLASDEAAPIEAGKPLELTYSVKWVPTEREFATRFNRYLDNSFFEHQIHWFSLFNSFMMVIFLCGLVTLILMRTLRADYVRYMREDDEEGGGVMDGGGLGEETGWKQVYSDVFRKPADVALFSALVGTGTQLALLALVVIGAAFAGSLYVDRGAITTAGIVGFALTSFISGFFSGSYYRSFFNPEPSPEWIRVMLLSASLFPAIVGAALVGLNAVAISYGSTNVVPFWAMAKMFAIWAVVSLPLAVCGTILGRRFGSAAGPPLRVNPVARPIPARPWYRSATFVCLLAGFLPFGSIFIETYFIFSSFSTYKFYYVFGFMFAVYVILVLTTSCVTVVSTYFLLNSEDHRWQWHAFYAGASTGLYVFVYACYYFLFRTECVWVGVAQPIHPFFPPFPPISAHAPPTSDAPLPSPSQHAE
jgi:transmembrane 9 superfamily protein 3